MSNFDDLQALSPIRKFMVFALVANIFVGPYLYDALGLTSIFSGWKRVDFKIELSPEDQKQYDELGELVREQRKRKQFYPDAQIKLPEESSLMEILGLVAVVGSKTGFWWLMNLILIFGFFLSKKPESTE